MTPATDWPNGVFGGAASDLLLDSSAWIKHIRRGDAVVDQALADGRARGHPDVAGEVAMGTGSHASQLRDTILRLPQVEPVERRQLFALVEERAMNGRGIGWIDAGIVAACLATTPPTTLCTRDRRMLEMVRFIGVPVLERAE